jgi:hypothetical protein
MLFSIDNDAGSQIIGWVMPNNPSATPRVRVIVDGKVRHVIEATIFRPLLKEQGLHSTGICGFAITEKNCPGITKLEHVELRDDETGLLLFRRRPKSGILAAKLFRLEPRIIPRSAINEALIPFFHMAYTSLELQNEETLTSIFSIPFTDSLYLTGRIFFRAFEHQIKDRGFKSAILIRDPFHELAERMLVLRLLGNDSSGKVALFPSDVRKASRQFRDLDLSNADPMRKLLRSLDENSHKILSNPLTQVLANKSITETVNRTSLGAALDSLSEIDIVVPSDEVLRFFDLVGAMLETEDVFAVDTTAPKSYENIVAVSDILKTLPEAHAILEYDIELHSLVSEANRRVIQEDEAISLSMGQAKLS